MLAAESTIVKQAVNLLFIGLVASAAAVFVFRAELSDAIFDSLANNEAAARRNWDPATGGTFVLRPERNDPLFLQVTELRAGIATAAGTPVSFNLTNLGNANDFPNIAIVTIGTDGRPLRQLVFSPKEYAHDSRFGRQHVELLIQPRTGEQSFTVRVFYGDLS
jgi:hypothetical protein